MTVYVIEDNLISLFTAIFNAYEEKQDVIAITSEKGYQPSFDTVIKYVAEDKAKAERVKNGIIKNGGRLSLNDIETVIRSGSPYKHTAIFNYVKLLLKKQRYIGNMLAETDVIVFDELRQKVSNEIHRIYGFLRFIETESGVFYSPIEPDNDITDLIAPHFIKRFNMPFIIHDVKRNKLCLFDGKKAVFIKHDKPLSIYLSEKEEEIERLWKRYFKSVNIKSRPHIKQQANYLPRRYRKYMPEFYD